MTQHDLALVLLAKAQQDMQAVDALIDETAISDEIVGFHLQQATEKLLKAALAELEQEVPRTHSLVFLFDRLNGAGTSIPQNLSVLAELTPFAVEFRYGVLRAQSSPLDRHQMRALLDRLRTWTETLVFAGDAGTANP
jgi:HEPN domain-containing protein